MVRLLLLRRHLAVSGELVPAVPGNMNELSTEAALSCPAVLAAKALQTGGIAHLRSLRGDFGNG